MVKSGSAAPAQLLIGDQAIRFRQKHADEFQFWDLGEQWKKLIGLPFVYALWLIRPEVVAPKQIADRLRGLRDENLVHLNELIADAVGRVADPGDLRSLPNFLIVITTNIFDSALEKQRRKVCELLLSSAQSVVCLPGAGLRSISCSATAS